MSQAIRESLELAAVRVRATLAAMRERNANIGPRYAIRLDQLRGWHVLTAVCSECRHRASMRLWEVTRGLPGHTYLMDVEDRLRCRHCGNREGNRIYVTLADRN